jgi:hypothetical protein
MKDKQIEGDEVDEKRILSRETPWVKAQDTSTTIR